MALTTVKISDPTNNPSLVVFDMSVGNVTIKVTLPDDVLIGIDGDKVIAESKILDGVAVFERICRKPHAINFEFTCREKDDQGNYVFPQATIKTIMEQAWLPDQVVKVTNTFLNNLGIHNLVLQPITFATIRGSTSVLGSIKAKELYDNTSGSTLIIPV